MEIVYRTINRFRGYRFGSDGSVWTEWRFRGRGANRSMYQSGEWKPVAVPIGGRGYQLAHIRCEGTHQRHLVHRLILEAFNGPAPNGTEGCHGNGIKTDNRVDNLRWDTRVENCADSLRHGTRPRGEDKPNSKLTPADVKAMRRLRSSGISYESIAKRFHVSRGACTRAIKGESWKGVELCECR